METLWLWSLRELSAVCECRCVCVCVHICVGGSQRRRGGIIEFHSRGGKQARRKAKERKDPGGHETYASTPCGLTVGPVER